MNVKSVLTEDGIRGIVSTTPKNSKDPYGRVQVQAVVGRISKDESRMTTSRTLADPEAVTWGLHQLPKVIERRREALVTVTTVEPTTNNSYLARLGRMQGDRKSKGARSAPRGGSAQPRTDHLDILTEYAEGLALWSVTEYDFKPDSASIDEIHAHGWETLARRFHGLVERVLLLQSYPEQELAEVFAKYEIPIYVLMNPSTPPFRVEVTA